MEQMPSNVPMMEAKPGIAGWVSVWLKVITKPGEQTFIEITESAEATMRTAFIWMFIAGTVSGIFQALIRGIAMMIGGAPQLPIPGLQQYMPSTGSGDIGSTLTSLVVSLCLSPLVGVLSVVFFAIGVAITQWIAKLFGGTGTFEKLAYASAAISVPFTLITSVLSLFGIIPFVGICTGIISLLLAFYILYLQITAVKAVNRFSWGAAVGTVLIPGIAVGLVCGCIVFAGMMVMGPVIGNVFSSINQSLTP